jgi:hypothetical protein
MRRTRKKFAYLCTVLAAGLSWLDLAQAADDDPMNPASVSLTHALDRQATAIGLEEDTQRLDDEWRPASSAYLEEMRGGFDIGSGMRISFGIQRDAYINGDLVASTNFNIADIGKLGSEQARAINAAIIRNGNVESGIAQPATALVIQNTLNQQDIRSLTVINASANSLELIRSLNLHSTLTEALAESLRSR